MNNFILIETTGETCSAALTVEGQLVRKFISSEVMNHAQLLPTYLQQIIDYVHNNKITIDAVCISEGPGSYTGLRIGCSTAKGLCYAMNCKLVSINTLSLIAQITKNQYGIDNGYLCPAIDARRMEVYTAVYDTQLREIKGASAIILDNNFCADLAAGTTVYICGNGAEKCKKLSLNPNIKIVTDISPTADKMVDLAIQKFNNSKFEDVAYYEPFYLKEFHAITPSNKLFNLINGK